ncbi:MAG TPA: replication protein C [Gemmatimonadetes bacterium]|nr:replication protein C [Gemmatimonadota bacterium]
MDCALNPGRGLRRHDAAAAAADQLAQGFRGLPEGVTRGKVLGALKGAASSLGIDFRVVMLVDVLFGYTQDIDWQAAHEPIVWPSNEELAEKLGKSVRQVQYDLRAAQRFGLITHRDSPNGHRGGARKADGNIIWAYGISLGPIGARYEELRDTAKAADATKRLLKTLKARLAAARRKISCLTQTALDNAFDDLSSGEDLALARMATVQMRGEKSPERLNECVRQIEARQRALEASITSRLLTQDAPANTTDIACSREPERTHSTTTNHLSPAKAGYSSGLAGTGSGERPPSPSKVATVVEADLEEHGVGPEFINGVANDLCAEFEFAPTTWGPMVALAERLAAQNAIHQSAWREACRIMGERGAAASVIATLQKYRTGEVQRPGAYLRGMSGKALKGELRLGKTFHGLKDAGRSASMRSLADGSAPSHIGHLSRRIMANLAVRS